MTIQDPLTGLIIGCCFRVANELGPGFLEKVYENALAHELRKAKVKVVGVSDSLCLGRFHQCAPGGSRLRVIEMLRIHNGEVV